MKKGHFVCLSAAGLWLLFIWGNSLQTADVSSQLSSGVVEWFAPLLERIGLSEEMQHALIRKLAHMAEFAVAGLLWSAALAPKTENTPRIRWTRRGAALLVCLAAAIVDESIQRFVPGRSGELRDVCIDLTGAALGILAAAVIGRWLRHRTKNR